MGDETVGTGLVGQLEDDRRGQSETLIDPQEGECLVCFVLRSVHELGCDTSVRWSLRFRYQVAPTATGLEHRMATMGGLCDCELFLNAYELARELCERDVHTDELRAPTVLPVCSGVRPGSTQPCRNWVRRRRAR